MARHVFTKEERQKGARNQPREDRIRAGQNGFQATMERYPFMARKWLQHAPGMKRFNGTFQPMKPED